MSKRIEIKLPGSLDEYTITQAAESFHFITSKKKKHTWKVSEILELIEIISGTPVKDLRRVDIKYIRKCFDHIMDNWSRQKQEPPEKIKINGKTYVFDKKMGKGWHAGRFVDADNSGTEIKEYPQKIAAICYLPEGTEYDDSDVDERAEIFKEKFPGSAYIDLIDFFLRKYEQLHPGYSVLQIARGKNEIRKAMLQIKAAVRRG